MRPYSAVPELPTTRRCTCDRNCCALNSTSPRYRPRSAMSSSILRTYVSWPSLGAYLFSSSTNTTTCLTPRSRFSRCSRSLVDDAREDQILRVLLEMRRRRRHTPCGPRKLPNGRSLTVPSSVTRPAQRVEMFDRRLRTLRIVGDVMGAPALSSSLPPWPDSTSRNHARDRRTTERDIACSAKQWIAELAVDDRAPDEVDQRVGLRVDVVLVEQHLGVLQHFAQSPRERRHVVQQRLVRPERVEREAVGLVRREVLDVLERLGADTPHFSYSRGRRRRSRPAGRESRGRVPSR